MSIDRKAELTPEVSGMMRERHDAHRRGFYAVLGSISLFETARGILRFPVVDQRPTGPTIGYVTDQEKNPDPQKLVVLTEWNGLPDLNDKTEEFCPDCLADCPICNATGQKICEGLNCGGRGWTPGPLVDCDGAGCLKDSGKFNPECKKCGGFGQLHPQLECKVCKGTGKMICSYCKGKTRYATGIKGGSTDFMVGRCPSCQGTQRMMRVQQQSLETHINALLPDPKKGPIVAVGPIFSYVVDLTEEQREAIGTPLKIFDVNPDAAGDRMFLLIDSSSSPKWPYLVGGLIVERQSLVGVGAELPR